MTSVLNSNKAIEEALRNRMRIGEGLSAPHARKWAIGGCEASHSLWQYPHDAISDFADGLAELKIPVRADDDAILVEMDRATVWLAVSGNTRSADRASAFLVGHSEEKSAVVVVNSPEVVIELIRAYSAAPEPIPRTETIQVGFPGIHNESCTYVGSWQWNIHGEARGEKFVRRTANATLGAIRANEAKRGN